MNSLMPDFTPENQFKLGMFPNVTERHFAEIGQPIIEGLGEGSISSFMALPPVPERASIVPRPSELFKQSQQLGSRAIQNLNPRAQRHTPRSRSDAAKDTKFIF